VRLSLIVTTLGPVPERESAQGILMSRELRSEVLEAGA
jgi:hypothetical protein